MSRTLLTHQEVRKLDDALTLHGAKKMPMAQIIGWLRSLEFKVRSAADVHELRIRSIKGFKR